MMVALKSRKRQMMLTHASRAKTRGSVSTHHLDDDKEAEEKKTIFRRSGKLSETNHEREELLFVPSQELPNESADGRICSEVEEDLVERASEGDAPEIMTAAAGLSQSRSLASKAARVVERYGFFFLETVLVGLMSNLSRQKVAATQRRKELDIRLKSQAHSRKRKLMEIDLPGGTMENTPTSERINDKRGLHNPVPALLPDSILLVEPAGPVFKSNPIPKKSDSASHRLRSLIAVPPKDLKQGAKTVRILESNRVLLPPRSALCGKGVRESWIFGRRSGGRDRNGVVPRRKMGNGFLRSGGL